MSTVVNSKPFRKHWVLGGLGFVTAVAVTASCDFKRPPFADLGHEIGDINCHDGLDNDLDGLIDCEDVDCVYESTWCGEFIPPIEDNYIPEPETRLVDRYCGQNSPYYSVGKCQSAGFAMLAECHDSIDNDVDGQFDCGDEDCRDIAENCCALEFDDISCADGKDNDQNGFADCQDYSCRNGLFVTVCVEKTGKQCTDGVDNDGDLLIDCGDSDCREAAACGGTGTGIEQDGRLCRDKQDNDGDGRIDCVDMDCKELDVCKPDGASEDTLEACSDFLDNDGNEYIDCGDNACLNSMDSDVADYCRERVEDNVERCSDGIDNDTDGYVDCQDRSCTNTDYGATPESIAYCASLPSESSLADCQDGKDNDSNGYTDCKDFSCSNAERGALPEVVAYCANIEEATLDECKDGLDNDGDGFADCKDWSCTQKKDGAADEAIEHCASKAESSFAKCSNGIDDDKNGYVDCKDYSCSRAEDADGNPDFATRRACQESVGATPADANNACSNGLDDDVDGFIDCADWDCSNNPAVTACAGKPRVCGQ